MYLDSTMTTFIPEKSFINEHKNLNKGSSMFLSKVERGVSINANPGPGDYEILSERKLTINQAY